METANGTNRVTRQNVKTETDSRLKEGITLHLSQWNGLQMAVQNQWGGHDSIQKFHQLAADILSWFSQSNAPLDVEDLETLLHERMLLSFNTEIEDGSIEELELLVHHLVLWLLAGVKSFWQVASAPSMSKTKQLSPPEQMVKEGNFLEPVPPFYQGQGFPYAPTDWPGPGETWGWKVGRRISSCGYYTDRFLIPPRSLQKPSCPRYFASRRSIELYILKEFPDADIDAFFASFIWRVPSTLWHSTKVKAASLSPKKVEEVKEETPVTVRRKRKHTAAASLAKQRTRQSLRRSSGVITKDTDGKIDSCLLNNEAAILGKDMKSTSDSGDDQPGCDPIEGNNFRGKCMPENFDSYMDSIDDILAHPLSEACFAYAGTSSSSQEEELAEAQTSNLRKDPNLSAENLFKLKLIEEIPSYGKVFLENKRITEQAKNFFAVLEDKKARALSLKKEFYEMKDNIFQLQSELDSNLLAVKEIDDQIAKLQSERAELMATIEFRKAAKVKLDNDQQKVVNAIRKIVHVVQLANSKKG
ncbi:hypothetical protein WN944_025754 [Citrus x changshan-huyou]|uniref:DUF7081 domain-containing protein n=1 Tax=Citrus x changshan-huyou TaxID=2935761 RepID=A0AAP0LR62_9ROSI